MPIPDAADIFVSADKVLRFLLVPEHKDNKGRARLLFGLGYSVEDWETLASDLRSMALECDAIAVPSQHGRRFHVHGMLNGSKGSRPFRTIWEIRPGEDVARFVSAYPRSRL